MVAGKGGLTLALPVYKFLLSSLHGVFFAIVANGWRLLFGGDF